MRQWGAGKCKSLSNGASRTHRSTLLDHGITSRPPNVTSYYASNVEGWRSARIFGGHPYSSGSPTTNGFPVRMGLCLHQDMEPSTLTQNGLLVGGLERRFSC